MKPFLAALMFWFASQAMACVGENLPNADTSIQVVDAVVSTSKTDGMLMVTVLGAIQNAHTSKVDGLVMEAKLTDSSGKLIDVLSQPIYGLVVPAGEQVAFRLQAPAAAASGEYVGVQARVVSADSHRNASAGEVTESSGFDLHFLRSWGPMILLIAVWVLLVRKYSGKGSTQDKMLEVIGEQNFLLSKQTAAIESIASHLTMTSPPSAR